MRLGRGAAGEEWPGVGRLRRRRDEHCLAGVDDEATCAAPYDPDMVPRLSDGHAGTGHRGQQMAGRGGAVAGSAGALADREGINGIADSSTVSPNQ